ncbi:MAG: HAD family hydrolase [Sulfolobales archaeon]|nr:HAD family hydrolase [Sulfolobales archaeon]
MREHENSASKVPDKKVVFVDMGETIVSFNPKFWQPIYWTLRELGYDVTERTVYRAVMRVLGENHYPDPYIAGLSKLDIRKVLVSLGIVPRRDLVSHLESKRLLANEWTMFEDARRFLEEKKKKGYDIVMVTNSTPDLKEIRESLNLDNYITGYVASYEVGVLKPHPRIFRVAVDRYGYPEYHVGDVYEVDFIGAKRAGIRGIVLDRYSFYDDLKGVERVRSLLELL